MAIKFQRYYIQNTETGAKCRVFYSLDNHMSGKPCVTIYSKNRRGEMRQVLGDETRNDSDSMTDYFESDRARFFDGHPLYAAARKRAEAI